MIVAEHVVVVLVVLGRFGLIHLHETPVLHGMGRPVAVVVQRLDVVVGLESFRLAEHDRFESMCADADRNVVLAHDFVGLDDVVLLALVVPDVARPAPQVDRAGAQFQMCSTTPLELVDVGGDDVGEPHHLAAPLGPVVFQPKLLEVVVLQHDGVAAAAPRTS